MSARKSGRKGRQGAVGQAAPAVAPAAGAPRALRIDKIALFGLELGPFEVPLPGRLWPVLGLGLLLVAIAVAGLYALVLRAPMEGARAALRLALYDTALSELKQVPGWLALWPGLGALRDKAQLGRDLNSPPQNWQDLGMHLRALRAQAPDDPDLRVLTAALAIRANDFSGAAAALEGVPAADPDNAEAWFLLGLVADLQGEKGAAITHYRRAVTLAPESPQYRSNLARALLDLGEADAAVKEYREIGGLPLARLEQALGHWALGQWPEAAQAQADALAMLADAELMQRPFNRLGWRFVPADRPSPDDGIALSSPADKRCYALLGQAASRRLAGETGRPWSPPTCGAPPPDGAPPEVRALVADDLCRFADRRRPAAKAAVAAIRQALDRPPTCPPSPAPQVRPPAGT